MGVVATVSAPAFAVPFDPLNDRPIAIGVAPSSEATLQSILDDAFSYAGPAGTVDAISDQNPTGMWQHAALPGTGPFTTAPAMLVEYAGNAASNTFGIFSGTDSDALTSATIFTGAASSGSAALLYWTDQHTLNILCSPGVCGAGTYNIDAGRFGFFLGGVDGNMYTVDDLNPGGRAYALAYEDPTAPTTFVLAFEDLAHGDFDYNDMVVRVESIKPIPEPGTLLLMGAGLLGLALWDRRRGKSRGNA